MATHTCTAIISNEQELGGWLLNVNPSNLGNIKQSDSIKFVNPNFSDSSVLVGSFLSSLFTVSGSVTVASGSSVTRTLKSNASLGSSNLSVSAQGKSKTVNFVVITSVDTDPDALTVSNIILAQRSSYYYSQNNKVSGISQPVSVSGGNGTAWSKNGAAYTTSATTVAENDFIQFRQLSSSSYNSIKSATVSVGDWSQTWSVKTEPDPGSGETIPFPHTSAPFSGSDLTSFYGGGNSLDDFVKGGALVPNITKNAAVPTSAPISLSQFAGSGTSLYFSQSPNSKQDQLNTISNGGTMTVRWEKDADWDVGYGAISDSVEVRYTLIENNSHDTGATLNCNYPGQFHSSNTWVSVSKTVGSYTEENYSGNVKIEVRHKDHTQYTIERSPYYSLSAFGP